MITEGQPLLQIVALLVAGLGALNWGLKEAMDTDLLVEIGLTGSNLGLAYLAVGAAGAIVLVDLLTIISEEGADSSPLED